MAIAEPSPAAAQERVSPPDRIATAVRNRPPDPIYTSGGQAQRGAHST